MCRSVLFATTLTSTIVYMFQARRRASNTTHAPPTVNPAAGEEAGVQQVPHEVKQDTPYNPSANNPNQGGYPPVSPIQQQQYPPQGQQYPPQGQYPPPQQQGYPPQQQYPPLGEQQYPPPQQYSQGAAAGYYGGSQGEPTRDYPTPTPEMQAEKRDT